MIQGRAARDRVSVDEVLAALRERADPVNLSSLERSGIPSGRALGTRVPDIRAVAKSVGRNHQLARALWRTGVHEAMLLSAMVADPAHVTEADLQEWLSGFYSWDLVDQFCMNLFWKLTHAHDLARRWAAWKGEYARRAAFSQIAVLAVHDKEASDSAFERFFPVIESAAEDERNAVKKSVCWALRQIGKRSPGLRKKALACARHILSLSRDSRSAAWIAQATLRELGSP